MSVKAMAQVWGLNLPQNEKFVLLAMADHADHEGQGIRPSTARVAWKTGYSERQVRRIVDALVTRGVLSVTSVREGRPTVYAFHAEAAPMLPDVETGNPCQIVTPDKLSPLTQLCHPTPDIAMSPEPSYNHPNNSKQKSSLPEDFTVSDQMREWAYAKANAIVHRLTEETEAFKEYHRSKGSRFVDWRAAWRTWMLNEQKWAKGRSTSGSGRNAYHTPSPPSPVSYASTLPPDYDPDEEGLIKGDELRAAFAAMRDSIYAQGGNGNGE
jgi:hypothetical protein